MSEVPKNLYVHFSFGAHNAQAIKAELPKVIREVRTFFADPKPGQGNIFFGEDSSGRQHVVDFQKSLIEDGVSLLEAGAQGGYFALHGKPTTPEEAQRLARFTLRSRDPKFGIQLVDALDRIRGKDGVNFEWDSEAYPDEVTTRRMDDKRIAEGHYQRAKIAMFSGDYKTAASEGRKSLVSEQEDIAFRNDHYLAMLRKLQSEVPEDQLVKIFMRVGTDHDILFDRLQRQNILRSAELSKSYTRPVTNSIRRRILSRIEQAPWALVEDNTVLAYIAYVELINSEVAKSKKSFTDAEVEFNKSFSGITEDIVIEVFQRIIASAGSGHAKRMTNIKDLLNFRPTDIKF